MASDKASSSVKSTKLGGKIWFNGILFGLVGQIAWMVENMYFATFAQNIFEDTSNTATYIISPQPLWLSFPQLQLP